MKKKIFGVLGLLLFLCMAACSAAEEDISIETVDYHALAAYEETYIGNNSDVGAILTKLPGSNALVETSLSKGNLIVHYDTNKIDKQNKNAWYNKQLEIQTVFLHNILYLSALITNEENITLTLNNDETNYKIELSSSDLERFLDIDLAEKINHEQEWNSYLEEALRADNQQELVKKFPLQVQ
ncbi:DUF4825 domain-containing protein [Terribacillus sp. DMT04]|uniref:DUF4825 domain-containing protein n=1 Tax=Terribacillus sp. DMT04 TaxID=2850441 RepID=UPI001C2C435D|nr:DUF4825 domain-containing protein [Terribacillus sp. DMT04]QXE02312.1 DUF4825 domain-containing protein [Terribacillus sp. DMT04]